jgi:hypothetical protein
MSMPGKLTKLFSALEIKTLTQLAVGIRLAPAIFLSYW